MDIPNPIIALRDGSKDYIVPPAISYTPVDNATGKIKAYNGLTANQENFCRYIANGETMAGAYRKAYHTRHDLRPDSVYNRSSALAKRPSIRNRIDQLLTERETVAIADYAYLRKFIIERLQLEALQSNNDACRIKALELLGKIDKIQLFGESAAKEEDPKAAAKDLSKELERRLSKLMGGQLVNLQS